MARAGRAAPTLAAVVCLLALSGCARDAERAPAERRNLQALEQVPALSNTELVRTETRGFNQPDTDSDRIIGWSTYRTLRVLEPETFRGVIARLTEALERAGWRVTQRMSGRFLTARRAGTCMTVMPVSEAPSRDGPIPNPSVLANPGPGSEAARGLTFIVSGC